MAEERREAPAGDEQQLQRYREGDKGALEKLYLKYQIPLFNFIARSMGDRHAAEDILQEVFLRVMRKANDFSPAGEGTVGGWLYRIALNLCRDNQRKAKRVDEFAKSRAEELKRSGTATVGGGGPEDKIQEALATLAAEQKEVVMLRIYGELSFKEISEIQNCSLNTVLGRMHYALKNLRQRLGVMKV